MNFYLIDFKPLIFLALRGYNNTALRSLLRTSRLGGRFSCPFGCYSKENPCVNWSGCGEYLSYLPWQRYALLR